MTVDLLGLRYDTERQLSVDAAGAPICRHTNGRTSTRTSDGYQGMDSDEDFRED